MSSLDKIWLDFQDSLEAGNCLPGTTDMANRIKQRLGLEEDCQVSFRADEVLRTVQQYPHYNRNFENLLFRTVSRHYKSLVS
jgi:hypothetical protein